MTRLLPWLVLLPLLAPALFGQAPLPDATLEKPRTNLVIRVQGATRDWEVMPLAIKKGGTTIASTANDFRLERDKWERTGAPKRYRLDKWRKVFNDFTDTAPQAQGAFFEFQARAPRTPTLAGVVEERTSGRSTYFRVPCDKVKVLGYPQTWVNIYEDYVGQFEGDQRRLAVKAWEEANRSLIENADQVASGFSAEERNDFAEFYQKQFVYVRDRNPQLASIYQELAEYHRQRGNLDAELSTYLDGIENKVPSPQMEEFNLNVGRIFVTRLLLHRQALPYLQAARAFSEARVLAARCHIELGELDQAREMLKSLLAAIAASAADLVLELTPENETGRANLLLARVEFSEANYAAAEATIKLIPQASASWQEGQLLFAAMLTQRGLRDDFQKVKETLDPLPKMAEAKRLTSTKSTDPNLIYPYDPAMCEALVLYAQTDAQFRQPIETGDKPPVKPSDAVLRMLEVAKATDPLSAEPYLAEGRLKQRLGDFPGALEAYMAGLVIDPGNVRLNYAVAALRYKAGVVSEAKDLASRCLRQNPKFHPALVLLGEIALSDLDRLRDDLMQRRAAGEKVAFESELLGPLKEATAFFQGALEVQPAQPEVKLTLASLYLQLADITPATMNVKADAEDVRRAYLVKARDLAGELMAAVRKLGERSSVDEQATASEIAATPTPACFNVYAAACYAMGEYAQARSALEEHLAILRGPNARKHFASNRALSDYRNSEHVKYAERWLAAIRANERQYVEREEFSGEFKPDFYGQWNIVNAPKPDLSFMKSTGAGIKDGKLTIGLAGQKEAFVVSRLSVPKNYATLTRFSARFDKRGEQLFHRGVSLTKLSSNTGKPGLAPVNCVMLGIDPQGQVFWQVRRFKLDDQARQEEVVAGDLIDVRRYNGPLDKDAPLTLALVRRLSTDRSNIVFVAVINGYEVELTLPEGLDDVRRNDLEDKSLQIDCGFFVWALSDVAGEFSVDSAQFVFDSGLGKPE